MPSQRDHGLLEDAELTVDIDNGRFEETAEGSESTCLKSLVRPATLVATDTPLSETSSDREML